MNIDLNVGKSEVDWDEIAENVKLILQNELSEEKRKLVTKDIINDEVSKLRKIGVYEEKSECNNVYFPNKYVDSAVQNIIKLMNQVNVDANGTILESKSTSLAHNLESVVPLVDDKSFLEDKVLDNDIANYVEDSYTEDHINHELFQIFHCLYPEMDLTFLRNTIIRLKNDGVKIQEFLENSFNTLTFMSRSNVHEIDRQILLIQSKDETNDLWSCPECGGWQIISKKTCQTVTCLELISCGEFCGTCRIKLNEPFECQICKTEDDKLEN